MKRVIKLRVFLICVPGTNVWDDIHQDSQEFIKDYLKQYPEVHVGLNSNRRFCDL